MSGFSPRHISIFIPTLTGGGVEKNMVHLSRGFVDRGYTVDMVLAKAVGRLLLATMTLLAADNGIRAFRGDVHWKNELVQKWLGRLGATSVRDGSAGARAPAGPGERAAARSHAAASC